MQHLHYRLFAFVNSPTRMYCILIVNLRYRILWAISQDPKFLTLKLNSIVFKHKHKTFSYKPRPSS